MIRKQRPRMAALCLTAGLAGMLVAFPAASETDAHSRAAAAMKRGDYAVAYCTWRPLAVEGDAEAQYALGWLYHNGYGLAIDDRAAIAWWQRAVDQQHLEAMFSLGTLYSLGSDSVERDYKAAMRLWARAAAEGHEDAKIALRRLAGRGIPEVEEAAVELLGSRPEIFGDFLQIRVKRANIRSGPGTGYRILAVSERGDPVVQLVRRGNWVKIGTTNPPRIGWIYQSLIGGAERVAAD